MSNKAYIVVGYRVEDGLVPEDKLNELVENSGLSVIVSKDLITAPPAEEGSEPEEVAQYSSTVVGLILGSANLGESMVLDPNSSSKIEDGYVKALTAKSGTRAQMILVVGEKVASLP